MFKSALFRVLNLPNQTFGVHLYAFQNLPGHRLNEIYEKCDRVAFCRYSLLFMRFRPSRIWSLFFSIRSE